MGRIAFISPHLDDAVFSCAGLIQCFVAEGHSVEVITCFTNGPDADSREYFDRRDEDHRALAVLGVTGTHLGLVDAPFRESWARRGNRALFGSVEEDRETLRSIEQRLQSFFTDHSESQIFAPLGVGWHLDHLLVHEACLRLFDSDRLTFYEEIPYSEVAGQTDLRQAPHIATNQMISDCAGSLLGAPYVRTFMSDWTKDRFVEFLNQQGRIDRSIFEFIDRFELSREQTEKAVKSAKMYGSQEGVFFCETTKRVERYFKKVGDRGIADSRINRN